MNAIINVDLDKEIHPRLYAWKANMESFPAEELEVFSSLKIVQKTLKTDFWWGAATNKSSMPPKPIVAILASPKLSSFGGIVKGARRASPNLSIQPTAAAPAAAAALATGAPASHLSSSPVSFRSLAAAAQTFPLAQTFQAPPSKMRALFSEYRGVRPTSELDSPIGS